MFLEQKTSKKVDLDIVCPKYGCPLHLCILKHRFELAMSLIEEKVANPHILNPNGSNVMHILFANFMYNEVEAEKLAMKLIEVKVNINLVDNNGLTPIHVAIKKSQRKALEFALRFNQNGKTQGFNFNQRGKKNFTPLHYAVIKTDYESFIFLVTQKLCDIYALDDMYRTPRGLSLINSPFYKILYKQERRQVFRLAALSPLQPPPKLTTDPSRLN